MIAGDRILDIDVIKKNGVESNPNEIQTSERIYEVKPEFPILKKFEEKRGIYDLINVAIAVVKTFKNKKWKERWTLWLEEIKSFSELPQFFNYFSQDVEKGNTIYKLIDSIYDIDPVSQKDVQEKLTKQYEKIYTENVKYTYKIIDEVFKNHSDIQLKQTCIENGTFDKFLDRLSQLTGEKKRTKAPEIKIDGDGQPAFKDNLLKVPNSPDKAKKESP